MVGCSGELGGTGASNCFSQRGRPPLRAPGAARHLLASRDGGKQKTLFFSAPRFERSRAEEAAAWKGSLSTEKTEAFGDRPSMGARHPVAQMVRRPGLHLKGPDGHRGSQSQKRLARLARHWAADCWAQDEHGDLQGRAQRPHPFLPQIYCCRCG